MPNRTSAQTDSAQQHDSDLPVGLSKPALRALASAGYSRVEQFTHVTEADLLRLHGMGPKAIELLRQALAAKGLSLASDTPNNTVHR
jgi:hypothetical protein